jgi:hypothetical protein
MGKAAGKPTPELNPAEHLDDEAPWTPLLDILLPRLIERLGHLPAIHELEELLPQQDQLPCRIRSPLTGERRLLEPAIWSELKLITRWWSEPPVWLVVYRKLDHANVHGVRQFYPFNGGCVYHVWKPACAKRWPWLWPPPRNVQAHQSEILTRYFDKHFPNGLGKTKPEVGYQKLKDDPQMQDELRQLGRQMPSLTTLKRVAALRTK